MTHPFIANESDYSIGNEADSFIMSTSQYHVTEEQKNFFDENGYLIIQDALNPDERAALQTWAQQVHDLPRTKGVPWMPYEVTAPSMPELDVGDKYLGNQRHWTAGLVSDGELRQLPCWVQCPPSRAQAPQPSITALG